MPLINKELSEPLASNEATAVVNAFRGMSVDSLDHSLTPEKVHPAFIFHKETYHIQRDLTRQLMQDLVCFLCSPSSEY
jgi:hypothetical protein